MDNLPVVAAGVLGGIYLALLVAGNEAAALIAMIIATYAVLLGVADGSRSNK